jgi:predicted transcriptional regulator
VIIQGDGRDRLSSPLNILNDQDNNKIDRLDKTLRGGNNKRVPDELKDISAVLSNTGVSERQISKALDLSVGPVNGYKHGSFNGNIDIERKEKNDKVADVIKNDIRSRALCKLLDSINTIDTEKLSALGAVDATRVAVNLSAVVEKMDSKDNNMNINGNVIFMVPAPRHVSEYEQIDIEAQRVD